MQTVINLCLGIVSGIAIGLFLWFKQRSVLNRTWTELSWITTGLKLVLHMDDEQCQKAFHWSKAQTIERYVKRLERLTPYEYMRRFEDADPRDAVS